jgi:hypothetical protein
MLFDMHRGGSLSVGQERLAAVRTAPPVAELHRVGVGGDREAESASAALASWRAVEGVVSAGSGVDRIGCVGHGASMSERDVLDGHVATVQMAASVSRLVGAVR